MDSLFGDDNEGNDAAANTGTDNEEGGESWKEYCDAKFSSCSCVAQAGSSLASSSSLTELDVAQGAAVASTYLCVSTGGEKV